MELVEIAAGWFWMGWEDGHPGERPRHRVWLDAFAIARTPVSNAEYARFLEAAEAPPPTWWEDPLFNDPDQPVVGINWFEAALYCDWLSSERGGRCRLPTEAEWEKAARGGLDGARFPWGNERPAASTAPSSWRGRWRPPPIRWGSAPSRASATSGASTGRTGGTMRFRPRGIRRVRPTARGASREAAPGGTRTRGVPSPTGRACRPTSATPTTGSAS